MAKNQKSYTPEFKQQIVELYHAGVVLVYKCGQEKLNNLYYQMKEQRR